MKITVGLGLTCWATSTLAHTEQDTITEISAFFAEAKVIGTPKIVDCTLSSGTKTTCFSITLKADPQSYAPGPWCPTNIKDTAVAGGI